MRPDVQWGLAFAGPSGFIAEPGKEEFNHRFGGTSRSVTDFARIHDGPALLLVLDLRDPRLYRLHECGLAELPLCSYINCGIWSGTQVFQIHSDTSNIHMVSREIAFTEPLPQDISLPNPLTERRIGLRAMLASEYPIDEDAFGAAFNDFAGGPAFIRILGPPLWDSAQRVRCDCGYDMEYVAGLGHESLMHRSAFLDHGHFFIGEGQLYFHFCSRCYRLAVTAQGT